MITITALLFSTFVYENYSREWYEMTRRGTNPGQNMKIWKYPIIIHINKSIDTTHILPGHVLHSTCLGIYNFFSV